MDPATVWAFGRGSRRRMRRLDAPGVAEGGVAVRAAVEAGGAAVGPVAAVMHRLPMGSSRLPSYTPDSFHELPSNWVAGLPCSIYR